MINAHSSKCARDEGWDKPVSSTYLVMLRRYQSYLRDQDSSHISSFESNSIEQRTPANEYIENSISINQLKPIFSEMEKRIGHCAFGVDIGRYMHPSDYGIFGYAMMNCATIGLALETAARFKAIRNQNMTASFYRAGGQFKYETNTLYNDQTLDILVELDFSTAYQFGKLLVGPHKANSVKLDSVHFQHSALGPKAFYEERFGCPVFFNQEKNLVCLAEQVTNLPIYAANPKILAVLENKIEAIISKVKPNDIKLSKRVFGLLSNLSTSEFPCSSKVAQAFNMSLSSFKKYLKEEGTCFQDICEEARKERSFKLLTQDIPIKAISFELGFSNPSAFNRAFKRWTGESPASYRKNMK